jgi:hypothetical protein
LKVWHYELWRDRLPSEVLTVRDLGMGQEVVPEFPDSSKTGIMVYLLILGMLHYIMVFTTQ